jgi:hypothetical protein
MEANVRAPDMAVGVDALTVVLLPIWPELLLPQQYAEFVVVLMPQTVEPDAPPALNCVQFPVNPDGAYRAFVVPSPICPDVLSPQQ